MKKVYNILTLLAVFDNVSTIMMWCITVLPSMFIGDVFTVANIMDVIPVASCVIVVCELIVIVVALPVYTGHVLITKCKWMFTRIHCGIRRFNDWYRNDKRFMIHYEMDIGDEDVYRDIAVIRAADEACALYMLDMNLTADGFKLKNVISIHQVQYDITHISGILAEEVSHGFPIHQTVQC